ncbi:MAG: YeeE/YedE family protein [Deltaproteobacteria bacterium]
MGLATTALYLGNGRVAGISGICAGLLGGEEGDREWRGLFVVGLSLGGLVLVRFAPASARDALPRSAGALAIAGLLVGVGARLANGCTSGHGLFGLSRLSPRSFVAVATFMATGAATVFLVRHFAGGAL